MDISQFDKFGTGPLREKALADYLEALDGEETPGSGGIPNPMTDNYSLDANSFHHEIKNASRINLEAANGYLDISEDSTIIGVNGATNVYLEVTPDGVNINNNGVQGAIATKAYVDANAGGVSIPATAYASNAEAVAALGVGNLYKSTTLINGSPIILITV